MLDLHESDVKETQKNTIPKQKWVWYLALSPLLITIFIPASISASNRYAIPIIQFVLNSIFVLCDSAECKKCNINVKSDLFWGFTLVPVYLFLRSRKTDQQFIYAIVWCIIFLYQVGVRTKSWTFL